MSPSSIVGPSSVGPSSVGPASVGPMSVGRGESTSFYSIISCLCNTGTDYPTPGTFRSRDTVVASPAGINFSSSPGQTFFTSPQAR